MFQEAGQFAAGSEVKVYGNMMGIGESVHTETDPNTVGIPAEVKTKKHHTSRGANKRLSTATARRKQRGRSVHDMRPGGRCTKKKKKRKTSPPPLNISELISPDVIIHFMESLRNALPGL